MVVESVMSCRHEKRKQHNMASRAHIPPVTRSWFVTSGIGCLLALHDVRVLIIVGVFMKRRAKKRRFF